METHVKILAILKIVGGSLGLFAALIIFLVLGRPGAEFSAGLVEMAGNEFD